jgi:SAM-dependent methyltransferase
LSGKELWGDDFGPHEVTEWFADEQEGYADLANTRSHSVDSYEYNGLNSFHGFRHLPDRHFESVLGFGSGYGGEFLPILSSIGTLTILEPSLQLRSKELRGKSVRYVEPAPNGLMPFKDASFDLVLCFDALHHVANVTTILREIGRVTAPAGWVLIREPVVSMGDWRCYRGGLTKRERGIPRRVLETGIEAAGFTIRRSQLCVFPATNRVGRLLGRRPFSSLRGAALDRALCVATAWNLRYHARHAWEKVRPTGVFVVAEQIS